MENKLIDLFINQIHELYSVNENLARFLFERWNIANKYDSSTINEFLRGEEVKKVFLIKPDINIAREYLFTELKEIGINLQTVNEEKHHYRDSKYNYLWKEIYYGMADSWSGKYKIIDPKPEDDHLI